MATSSRRASRVSASNSISMWSRNIRLIPANGCICRWTPRPPTSKPSRRRADDLRLHHRWRRFLRLHPGQSTFRKRSAYGPTDRGRRLRRFLLVQDPGRLRPELLQSEGQFHVLVRAGAGPLKKPALFLASPAGGGGGGGGATH